MNKKLFISLITILIIMIFVVLAILFSLEPEQTNVELGNNSLSNIINETEINEGETSNIQGTIEKKYVSEINNKNELLDVKKCIEAFLYNASIESYNGTNLYDILDEEYLSEYNLEKGNLAGVASEYYGDFVFMIKSLYRYRIVNNINTYFVYGDLINTETAQKTEKSFIVKIDKINLAYSVLLENYMVDNGYEKENILHKEIGDFSKPYEIDQKRFNVFRLEKYDDEDYCTYYYSIYNTYLNYYPEGLYDIVDSEYIEKRFGNKENMGAYINKYSEELKTKMLFKYNAIDGSDCNIYVFIDSDNRQYVVKELSITDYKLYLDSYTIYLENFKEDYEDRNEEEKLQVNIDKFFQAIKCYDYEYIYNVLDEEFKIQNFPTIGVFEEYINNNLKFVRDIEYIEFHEETEICKYKVKLSDLEQSIEKTFAVKLLEGTDFTISFDI